MLEYLSVISERQEREIRANNTVVNQGINPVNTLPQLSSKRMAEYVVTNGERLYVVLKCYVVRKSSRKSSVDPIIVAVIKKTVWGRRRSVEASFMSFFEKHTLTLSRQPQLSNIQTNRHNFSFQFFIFYFFLRIIRLQCLQHRSG